MSSHEFPFEWFVNVYTIDHVVKPKDEKIIDKIYAKHSNNYKKFMNEVAKKTHIGNIDKYLKQEKYCILCNKNYPLSLDPFLVIKKANIDVTYEYCKSCVNISKCIKCKRVTDEPWMVFYANEHGNIVSCEFCDK